MDSFRDRTVLVTGASGGIGEAMARQLAYDGARLVLTARSADRLDRLADEFRRLGTEAHALPHDLGEPGAAQPLAERLEREGLRVDVLINNAGFGKQGAFTAHEAAEYEAMVTLNVASLVALTRLLLPAMLERGTGGVLNVASTAAFQPVPYFAVYAATKAFVKSFSEALHAEVGGSGVHVTCLAPGPTTTGFFDRADMDGVPGGRSAETPEKVARRGLEALLENDRLAVSGALNAVVATATRFVPTALVLEAGKRMMRD